MKYILTCFDPKTGQTLTFRGEVKTMKQRREVESIYRGMGFLQVEMKRDPEDREEGYDAEETDE